MEPVTHDPGLPQFGRQGEHLGHIGLGAVERRVEAGHLRQLGSTLQRSANRSEIVRLMQGGQRNEGFQHLQHLCIHAHRLCVGQAPVHHPVPDADQPVVRQFRPQIADQMVERPVMAQLDAIGPGLLGFHSTVGRLRNKTRGSVKPFDLAPHVWLQGFPALHKQRKLDAR